MWVALTIVCLLAAAVIAGGVWWRVFNTEAGERYLKMRTQGPFVPVSDDEDFVQAKDKVQ
ncbi:hypothetical protein [uncultured Rhodoferax sp.]|uniref:hypothetical protein n=1 Tax=uncultured Rhodoferax sp. TaxID=223188 RepID=UPI0025E72BDD|nr:hypothetical protein [uncultured Rhodoferax sp.]